MGYEETHKLVLTKLAIRQLQERAIEANVTTLLASVNNKSLAVRGWTVERTLEGYYPKGWKQRSFYGEGDAQYKYEMYLTVTYNRKDEKKPGTNDFASICKTIYSRVQGANFGKWTLETVDDKEYVAPTDDNISSNVNRDLIGYATVEIPDDFEEYFSHLYGLDAHIAMAKRALEAGVLSNWDKRFHCVFVGPPGCGKSDLCQTIKRALGDDAVLEYDATATTAAGAIKDLTEREILPRVLIIEEIEKADEKSMSFLLALLDQRAEVRKTTARDQIQRDTKLFCIATVNNWELFNKQQAGALASRFAQKIGFNRPNREQLAMILDREIRKLPDGDLDWIQPTLDYCEEEGITDPRQVTSICLCGRELLKTGEYQKMMRATNIEQINTVADWSTPDE